MSRPREAPSVSPGSAEERTEQLCRRIRPALVEAFRRNDPAVVGITFDDIEASASAVGDLVARLLMQVAVESHPPASEKEIAAARREALSAADPNLAAGRTPESLRMTRCRGRPRILQTARGKVSYAREYLHFPDLKAGLFPPR